MKYVNRLFINFIIHDFKQIAIGIETQEQAFIFKFIDYIIVEKITKSVPYISFGYSMLESGRTKLNYTIIHGTLCYSVIPQNTRSLSNRLPPKSRERRGAHLRPKTQGDSMYFFSLKNPLNTATVLKKISPRSRKSRKREEQRRYSLKNVLAFFAFAVKTSSIPVVSQGFESKCFCPGIKPLFH
jgi:hypothetical protein